MSVPDSATPHLPISTPSSSSSAPLLRVLSLPMAMAMVIGNVIGAGIFMKPSEAVAMAGRFDLVFAAWIVGGAISVLGALCFAELALMLPRAGGMYVYLEAAFGRTVAFLFAWSEFLFGRPASIGALSVGVVYQWGVLSGRDVGLVESLVISAALVFGLTIINLLGVIYGGGMQLGTTIVKAGFLILLACLPLVLMSFGETGIIPSHYAGTVTPQKATFSTQFAAALLAVLWAYNGWHAVTPVAEEVKNPKRNIPLALFGGLGILITIYLGVNLAYHGCMTLDEIKAAGIGLPQAMVTKLLDPIGGNWSRIGVWVITLTAVCSMVGSLNANFMNGPRIVFATGRNEPALSNLARVHPRWRTPWVAILVQGGMSLVMLIASALLIDRFAIFRERSLFDLLTDYVIFSASIFYMLAVTAVPILRKKLPDADRPYRTWGYPVVPAAYLLINAWFLWHVFAGKPEESLIGLGLSLAGLPVYALLRARPGSGGGPPSLPDRTKADGNFGADSDG